MHYVRFVKWPTQSGLAISRKCCFPHGPTRVRPSGSGIRRRSPRRSRIGGAAHAQGHITLVSNDHQRFVVPPDVAYMSDTIKQMDADHTEDVPLMNVDGLNLEVVLEYCRFHAPSSHHSEPERRDFDDDYIRHLNSDYDRTFQLFSAALYLDIKPLLQLLSEHVACRVLTEWTDSDAVKQAFEIDHERNGTIRMDSSTRRALTRGLEIEAKYHRKPCSRAVLYDQETRADMERLYLLEYRLIIPMARASILRSGHDAPRSRLASMLLRLPLPSVGLICEHLTKPTALLLEIIRGRENKFDHLLRDLREMGRLEEYVNTGVAWSQLSLGWTDAHEKAR